MKGPWYLSMLVLVCAPLPAEIYKCTNAQGDTQYSDGQCGSEATVFVPEAAPEPANDAAARMEKTQRLLQAYDAMNAEQQRRDMAARVVRAEREQQCSQARNRLRAVEQARALYRLNKEGKRVALSFEERAASEERLRSQVERWCH
jgi:hypothetical protein